MPQYYLDRYFVPDDKDLYDMLMACNTAHDKLWQFSRNYGILTSADEPKSRLIDHISRLPVDRRRLQEIFFLNSSKDRDEKYSTRSIKEDVSIEKMKAVVAAVRDQRASVKKEEYKIEQVASDTFNVKIGYLEPDLSRAEAIQTRERELSIQIIKKDGKLSIRHHSNDKAVEVVNAIVENLAASMGIKPTARTLDFSGLRHPKMRTQFFTELSKKLDGFKLTDVPTLKVYRLIKSEGDASADGDKEVAAASAQVKRIFLAGTDLMRSQEYVDLEGRGFFISAMSWISEHSSDGQEHFEFSAEFTSPETPVDVKYGCGGKYLRNEDGTVKKYKTSISALERDTLLSKLETAAFDVYDRLLTENTAAPLGDANPGKVV